MEKAVFLDRDGTIIRNHHYGHDPDKIELIPGAAAGLRALQGAGYRLIVVTNQSGIARGIFTEAMLTTMHERLAQILAAERVSISAIYHCPHHVDGVVPEYAFSCSCRKPEPGMLLRAAQDFQIDLRRSWLIGDILDDVEAGHRAGCQSILIDLHTEELPATPPRTPEYVAKDFLSAAHYILSHPHECSPKDDFAMSTAQAGEGMSFVHREARRGPTME